MAHAIKLSEAFQVVDNGIRKKKGPSKDRPKRGGGGDVSAPDTMTPTSPKSPKKSTKKAPICPYEPHKSKGYHHWLKDCTACTEEEKTALFKQLADEKAATGPSKSTRGQKQRDDPKHPVAGRLQPTIGKTISSSFTVTLCDGNECMAAQGRADDGSDESIVSSTVAEKAVLNGIGKLTKIDPVFLQVALKQGDNAEKFTFSRTWTPPRTVLQLLVGPLALVNVTYLVADADLAAESLLIGLPVLQHLGVDTKTLLEERRDRLDGADCSAVKAATSGSGGGRVSRLMIARLNRVTNDSVEPVIHPDDNRHHVDFFKVREEADPFPDASLLDPLDADQHDEIQEALESMVQDAKKNGLPGHREAELRRIIFDRKDIFRVSFSSGPPAKVEPLKIDLVSDARPVRVKLRNYSQDQRNFLSNFVEKLVNAGMAYPNPTSPWASAPLLVPKPGPAAFRFTVDLRPVNRFTIRHQFPMPNLEQELTKTAGSTIYSTFDFSHSYWQLPLAAESQECQSFITPDGIITPTRVLHGTTNAVMFLQSTLATHLPAVLRQFLLWWLDDILLHSKTINDHLDGIRRLFDFCVEFNLKLHPLKCQLFRSTIRWCGRLLSPDGIRFDPARIDGIKNMTQPTNGAELQQFVCAMQWMRNGIPKFSTLIRPLSLLLEEVYKTVGKRTRLAAGKLPLSSSHWGQPESDAFDLCKQALENQVTLTHRDLSKRLCVFTDASELLWSGIVTQVPFGDLAKPFVDQRHAPLCFLSGQFTNAELRWATIEKEAYATMATVERMNWLLATTDGFDLFTDHKNLIFLFDPLAVVTDMSQTTLRKVLRWAVRLSAYNYTCVHISGVDNVWADILSRWVYRAVVRRLVSIPTLPSSSASDFEWPSPESISAAQAKFAASRPPRLMLIDGLWKNPAGSIWIPDDSDDLQLRLCIIAHTGPSGHRGAKSTESTLRKNFFWSTMTSDVRTFVRSCIHCLSTIGGEKVPRPFGPAIHGTKANDLLQFDYVEIANTPSGMKYILMLRDDHSDYKWLLPFPDTSAENAARAIIDWSAAFGVPKGLMSDGPTHFKNETMRLVSKGLKVPHHFTLPYSPWSNGAVERLGKELLRVFRSKSSELQMRPNEWPDLLPLVQSVLNNAPSPQRANVSPVTAFTGMEASPPISTFIRSSTTTPVTVREAQQERLSSIYDLRKTIDDLHPIVQDAVQSNRRRIRESQSAGKLPNFAAGDFVLVARDDFTAGEKLSLRWRGPRRVVCSLNDHVYQVEDLRNGEVEDVHCTRLKFYHDPSLDTEAIMSHAISSETGMPVQRLMQLVDTDDGIMVQVRWRGLPPSGDTFEPLAAIYDDVPTLLRKLLQRRNTPGDLKRKAVASLGLHDV